MCFKRKHAIKDYHKKLNNIDKLFVRIFFSSLLLFSLIIIDKVDYKLFNNFTNSLNDNINFIKYSKMFNGIFGNFIPISDDVTVDQEIYYDIIEYDKNINKISNYTFEGVNTCSSGVVTKISKDKNKLYSITIKADDDTNYIYSNLISCDVRIYSYINRGDLIGQAGYDDINKCYSFNLMIEKNGVYYDYFEKD